MTSSLPWIILFTPLLSAAFITLFTQKQRGLSATISVAAVLVSLAGSLLVFAQADPTAPNQFLWLDLGNFFQVPIGVTIDKLSKVMLLVVTVIGSLIHIYSLGYMADDEGKSRYFAGLSLFMFSMLGIVLANNFVMMFIFWELVGVSSYILIGHWFSKDSAAAAANKAFITNRLGDFGFVLGILLLWSYMGSIDFAQLAITTKYVVAGKADLTIPTIAALLIFCGTVGKSAQFPLHVWLPDAMEGPTPVSALIHAATMVAAGVYMLCRVFFLIGASPEALTIIAWIGTITAVLAALMATQQNDIKRILAYSTLSQLGYMVMSVGLAAPDAAMFHLFTHAFFKALLFLGAGAIIYAVHHEQDIWKMGGLMKKMPLTFATFAVATLALTGFPGLSGFFSKDAILATAFEHNKPIFWLALGTAFLTAFYMFRLCVVVFFGKAKSDHAGHAHDGPGVMTVPLLILGVFSVIAGWPFIAGRFLTLPHEEAHSLFVPAAAFSVFALGAVGAFVLYSGKKQEPVVIPLFANKFYIDEIYAFLIRWTHDLLASLAAQFDRLVLDGGIVRGLFGGGTYGLGFVLRFLQWGNLQAYALVFGAGVVVLIYYTLFK
jgi:NADH-quinone oxidoreductase subunit L